MRWHRILVVAIGLIAFSATGLFLRVYLQLSKARHLMQAQSDRPRVIFDISDSTARRRLEWLRNSFQPVNQDSLLYTCNEYTAETYRVLYTTSWNRILPLFVEARKASVFASVTALQGSSYPPAPPPKPGKSATNQPQSDDTRLLLHKTLTDEQWTTIRDTADRLFLEPRPSMANDIGADGSDLTIELCRNGHYSYFTRWMPEPNISNDVAIIDLANSLFVLAGQEKYVAP